jgi:tRNA(His) guanylyltransferase
MQNREIFSSLTIIPPIILRVDGRAFHHLSRALGLQKPFDERFHEAMCSVGVALLRDSGLNPVFAYTFSDEISLYFEHLPFNGRVEKIDSVGASFAASALTIELGCAAPVAFDARVIPLAGPQLVVEYLVSRQQEAWRNHMNAYCQHTLMKEGMTARQAAAALKGVEAPAMHEMMHARGINLAKTPAWQRRGSLVLLETRKKEGFNPVTGETVEVERTVPRVRQALPLFSAPDGEALIRSLLGSP